MTVVPVLRQRSYKAAESSYNPCKVLKAHNEAPMSGLRILRRRAASCWLLLAAPTCMMHLVTEALSSVEALSLQLVTLPADQRVPYRRHCLSCCSNSGGEPIFFCCARPARAIMMLTQHFFER